MLSINPNSPTGYSFYKETLKSHKYSMTQWLIIPVHCGSAVADPHGFSLRLDESQLRDPKRKYSHYNVLQITFFHVVSPDEASLSCSCQHSTASITVRMTTWWQACVTVKRLYTTSQMTDSNTCNGNLLFNTTWLSRTSGHSNFG